MDDLADILRTNRLAVAQEEAERKVRVKVKHGAAVHPESGMIEYAHVYKDGHRIYDAVLNLTDVGSGMNSYYMLQVIKHDTQNVWYVAACFASQTIGHTVVSFNQVPIPKMGSSGHQERWPQNRGVSQSSARLRQF